MHLSILRTGSICLLLLFVCPTVFGTPVVHHDLEVSLHPTEGGLEVQDTIILPQEVSSIEFSLHQNLILSTNASFSLLPLGQSHSTAGVTVNYYRAKFSSPTKSFTLAFKGKISHSLEQMSQDYGGDLAQTPGIISSDGVFLSLASRWFPLFGNERFTFAITSRLPEGWKAVSQGRETSDGGWHETAPQDDIYLVAAPYHVYRRHTPVAEAMVFLRQDDVATAERYLDATNHYLELYSRLLGDYPYAKFALVENFWETGYGMPSFTLLGPTVIRLPFIIHTSYPHEILHNWWGNGVYIDYGSGNWSEGLTSYLADHLLKAQQGKGAEYRRSSLQRYSDFIAEEKDFSLTEFRSRHGQASQAIGYGKTMMFFHMLRQQLGDVPFLEGLRRFYRDNLFQVAGFTELQRAFEAASGKDLNNAFRQGTTRTGAPALQLGNVEVESTKSGYHLKIPLLQTQADAPFSLNVPVFIQLEGEEKPQRHDLIMDNKEATLDLDLPARPLRIMVDPQFDLFRRLDPSEIPSSLGQLFGADKILVVLPAEDAPEMKTAYEALAKSWAARAPGMQIKWDNQLTSLPPDKMVWLFGANNHLGEAFMGGIGDKAYQQDKNQITLAGETFSRHDHSFVVTSENPTHPTQTIGWVTAASPAAVPLLGRKLPHYMKYSYLVFEGERVRNKLKGQWQLDESALSITLPGGKGQPGMNLAPKPPLSSLVMPQRVD